MARRLRQVIDLYVTGKVATLADGSPVWVQALNPFEQDTARNEATIARARITLALKEFGGDEQAKVRMYFFEDGLDAARAKLIDAKVANALPKILETMRNDPEWNERLTVLDRGLDDTATVIEPAEEQLLIKIAEDYQAELGRRFADERDYQTDVYRLMDEEGLWEAYLDWYIDRRGAELQLAEYKLHQIMFGTRWCEAIKDEADRWDHAGCNGHQERVFADANEVRSAPEDLQAALLQAHEDVEMTVREAKNSDRQGSSSDSSPLPSEAAESTVSTQDETPVAPPGISSSPSPTPSPSSASES